MLRPLFRLAALPRISLTAAARPSAALPSRSYAGAAAAPSKADIEARIIGVLKGFDKVDPAKITPEANFISDLGLDSLDTVEVTMAIEEEFNVELPDEEAESIFTVKQAVEKIASNPHAI